MVERDGLTEEQIPINGRCGAPSKVIDRLTGEARRAWPTFATSPLTEHHSTVFRRRAFLNSSGT